jgi:hypothetical protein
MWSVAELSTLNYLRDTVVVADNERDKFDQLLKNVWSICQELIDRAQTSWQLVFPHVQRLSENKKKSRMYSVFAGFVKFVVAFSVIGFKSHWGRECKSAFSVLLRSQRGAPNVEAITVRPWPCATDWHFCRTFWNSEQNFVTKSCRGNLNFVKSTLAKPYCTYGRTWISIRTLHGYDIFWWNSVEESRRSENHTLLTAAHENSPDFLHFSDLDAVRHGRCVQKSVVCQWTSRISALWKRCFN